MGVRHLFPEVEKIGARSQFKLPLEEVPDPYLFNQFGGRGGCSARICMCRGIGHGVGTGIR
jgi:hypothetical protein